MTVLRSACWGVVLVAWGPWVGPVMREALALADGPAPAATPAVAKTSDKEAVKQAPRADDKPAPKFMRVKKDDRQEVVALETSVVRYTADPAKRPGVFVDLIGAIHVGDKAYYDGLNKLFADYDAVLYELVAPEGTRIPKEGRPSGNAHPVGALQNGLKSMLDLDHLPDK